MIIIDIVNIVASAKIEKIDVSDIASRVPCDYVPARFAAAVISVPKKSKKVNVNVYQNTMTSTGANKEPDAVSAIHEAMEMITRYGITIKFLQPPRISNITAVVYPKDERVNPEKIANTKKVPFFSTHVKVKDSQNGATALVAKSGKVTITGVDSTKKIIGAAKRLFTV